jgi:hypothetical protein
VDGRLHLPRLGRHAHLALPGEPDRVCDTVAEFLPVAGGPRRLLDAEVQAEPDGAFLERAGEYAFRLRRELRYAQGRAGQYRVAVLVLNLTGPTQPDTLDLTEEDLDGAGRWFQVRQATLSAESAADALARVARGEWDRCVLPWVVLMHGAREPAIIAEWMKLAGQEPDARWRSDLGGLALVFVELTEHTAAWRRALEGWNVRQSPQVLEWQARANQAGRAEGRTEGQRRLGELQLTEQLGHLSQPVLARLAQAADLDRLARALNRAKSLGELTLE